MKLYLPLSKVFVYVVVGYLPLLIMYYIPTIDKQLLATLILAHSYLAFALLTMSLMWARKENK